MELKIKPFCLAHLGLSLPLIDLLPPAFQLLPPLIIMSLKNEHQNLTIDQILKFSDDTNDGQRREKPEPEESEEFPLITDRKSVV